MCTILVQTLLAAVMDHKVSVEVGEEDDEPGSVPAADLIRPISQTRLVPVVFDKSEQRETQAESAEKGSYISSHG